MEEYSVSFIRHTRDQSNTVYFHGRVKFNISNGFMSVVNTHMKEAVQDVLVQACPVPQICKKTVQ